MNSLIEYGKVVVCAVMSLLFCQSVFAQDNNVLSGLMEDWPSHQVYHLLEPRGTYLLDFDKIYETAVSLDVETAITLPDGYTFVLSRAGSIDFINAFVMQNTLFMTKTVDHVMSTSVICNVLTPSGETKNLVFKVKGGPKEPIVYAIHFVVDKAKIQEEQPIIIERDCGQEVNLVVGKKEKDLNESVHRTTMVNALPAFFNTHRGGMSKEYKGARVWFNGIIFSRNDAYIYLYTNVRREQCDIINLRAVRYGKNELEATLVELFENIDGSWVYVYRAPLQMPSKNKRIKLQFVVEIWSKLFNYKAFMS